MIERAEMVSCVVRIGPAENQSLSYGTGNLTRAKDRNDLIDYEHAVRMRHRARALICSVAHASMHGTVAQGSRRSGMMAGQSGDVERLNPDLARSGNRLAASYPALSYVHIRYSPDLLYKNMRLVQFVRVVASAHLHQIGSGGKEGEA